jgi:hypothetical protein
MKNKLHSVLARLRGRNSTSTPKEVIVSQMTESRPLPMGRQEFEEWSDRIIGGALVPGQGDDPQAFIDSQKFVLADAITHLGPTESHKPDAYFIHVLRKLAANQVAIVRRAEIKAAADKRRAEASLAAEAADEAKAKDEANKA